MRGNEERGSTSFFRVCLPDPGHHGLPRDGRPHQSHDAHRHADAICPNRDITRSPTRSIIQEMRRVLTIEAWTTVTRAGVRRSPQRSAVSPCVMARNVGTGAMGSTRKRIEVNVTRASCANSPTNGLVSLLELVRHWTDE